MYLLDVAKLDAGLQSDYGLQSTYAYPNSGSRFALLVAADGLPIEVGYSDNGGNPLLEPSNCSVSARPPEPKNLYHTIRLAQLPHYPMFAILNENDGDDLLENRSATPNIISVESIQQPRLDVVTRYLVAGAFVVNKEIGLEHRAFARQNKYNVEAIRQYGLTIIGAGDVLIEIDQPLLDGYAQLGLESRNVV